MDIAKDLLTGNDYNPDEDPCLYISEKTKRGPLTPNWLEDYSEAANSTKNPVMCAYKLCRVEFRYWGMQYKIEKFIHDVGKYHGPEFTHFDKYRSNNSRKFGAIDKIECRI